MNRPMLGMVVGAVLGALDGLSAWFSPEARPMMLTIVIGSTVKGIVTGLLAGLVARWRRSIAVGVGAGLVIGFALSSLAALGQPDHYLEIVLPGMTVGALVGFVTQWYPANRQISRTLQAVIVAAGVASLSHAIVRAQGQSPAPADPLAPVARLEGHWTGTAEGQPGKGTVERTYERVLGSRFIQVRNRSTYAPQEKNPKGEIHEDIGFFSFDSRRKLIAFRQFHVEGFVTQYVLEPGATPDRMVFVSESIENIPDGFRARETCVFSGADQFEEIFEIAAPGKDFEVYSRSRLVRSRRTGDARILPE